MGQHWKLRQSIKIVSRSSYMKYIDRIHDTYYFHRTCVTLHDRKEECAKILLLTFLLRNQN